VTATHLPGSSPQVCAWASTEQHGSVFAAFQDLASSDRTDPRDASGGIAIIAIPIGAFCRRGGAVEATRLRNEIVQFLLRNFHTQNIIC